MPREALPAEAPRLIQFRCNIGGHLFYFQGLAFNRTRDARLGSYKCPICGSTRVQATGRMFRALKEHTGGWVE